MTEPSIDPAIEILLLPEEAADAWYGDVSPFTIRRWMMKGFRGVKLDSVLLGRRRYTSEFAMRRFFKLINKEDQEGLAPVAEEMVECQGSGYNAELEEGW